MKKILLHIVFLSALTAVASAQIVDTTKKINTWKLVHHNTRFEDTPLDTFLYDVHLGFDPLHRHGVFASENLGIIGHAARTLYLFDRPGTSSFLFAEGLHDYLATPDRTIFFNTRSPFTEITYSTRLGVDWNEETVRFLHTQNMDPYTNIGLDLELLSGKALYDNQDSRFSRFTLFGSSAREKYSAFGTVHFNRFNNQENGGLLDLQAFLDHTLEDQWLYPVKLTSAASSYTRLQLFFTQKLMLSEKIHHTDSLGVQSDSGRNVSLNHQIQLVRNRRTYQDEVSSGVPDFYENYFYTDDFAFDSVVHDQITNTVQLVLGDPYTDLLSARAYAGHEFSRYGQLSPEIRQVYSHTDTLSRDPLSLDSIFRDSAAAVFNNQYFNDLFVGFYMAGPPDRPWYWNIDGKYYLAGYFRNNFIANATFSRQVFKTYRLGLKGILENRNVSYYHNHYTSTFFQWQRDFSASQLIRGEAFLSSTEHALNATVSAGIWTNYLYWDQQALPVQHDQAILILSGKLRKHFTISGFHSGNQLAIQYSTAGDILRVPLAALRTSNYWEQSFFKGALIAQLGADLYITTPYKGNAYMPATGIFYLQNEQMVGGYPFVDPFLAFRIKRTRIFLSYTNALAGLVSYNYFTTAGIPGKHGTFRFGLAWTFYD